MRLDICRATQLRAKSVQLLRMALARPEPERSELVSIGTEMAREARILALERPPGLDGPALVGADA